jgi:hypothetical protein
MDVQKNSGLTRTSRSHKNDQAVIQLCRLLHFVNYDIGERFCQFESPPEPRLLELLLQKGRYFLMVKITSVFLLI